MENKILNTFYHVESMLYQNFDEIPEELVENGKKCCQLFPEFYKRFCNGAGDVVASDRELASYFLTLTAILNANIEIA
jgi:intein-encoded DNA endonuclease-like protein